MAKRQEMKSALIQQFPLEIAVIQLTQETASFNDFDDDDESGSRLENAESSKTKKVKEKIKDKLSYLNPKRHKNDDLALENINLKKEDMGDIKVDMTSADDKLNEAKSLKLSRVKDNWKDIIVKLLEENYTLSSLLRISEPLKCDGNILEIAVKNKFYHDRIANYNNKLLVEKVISEVLKSEVKIKPIIKEDVTPIVIEIDGIGSTNEETFSRESIQVAAQPKELSTNSEKISLDKPADVTQDVISMF